MEKKKAGEEEARRARERQLFEQSRSRAVAKLSEGKKMTLEELKLIYGDEGEAFGRL